MQQLSIGAFFIFLIWKIPEKRYMAFHVTDKSMRQNLLTKRQTLPEQQYRKVYAY
jgi:hypothetical protein